MGPNGSGKSTLGLAVMGHPSYEITSGSIELDGHDLVERTADERARAFDRFWRAADAPAGGTGLGLAIVHQLVRAGDGWCELRTAETGGVDAVVRLRPSATPT